MLNQYREFIVRDGTPSTVRNNNTGARLNLKILDIGSRAYQTLLFKFIAERSAERKAGTRKCNGMGYVRRGNPSLV